MAAWLLRGEAPERFSIDDDLELRAADKSKDHHSLHPAHPLDGKEIQAHLASGKYPHAARLDVERSRVPSCSRTSCR